MLQRGTELLCRDVLEVAMPLAANIAGPHLLKRLYTRKHFIGTMLRCLSWIGQGVLHSISGLVTRRPWKNRSEKCMKRDRSLERCLHLGGPEDVAASTVFVGWCTSAG